MTSKDKILDIAMNLNRIGNWAADDYIGRRKRILTFLDQTNDYINTLDTRKFSKKFNKTYNNFVKNYSELEKIGRKGPKNPLFWAEDMMTWGNILTHRARLI